MSKAEERALEKYPLLVDDDKEGLEALKYVGMECECVSVFNEVQESKQAYFIEGYRQAEKDLELTWEDMEKIVDLYEDVYCGFYGNGGKTNTEEHYQEVLKRFKDLKK